MAVFKRGEVVKVRSIVPQGPITSMRMDEDGNVQYLISWTDAYDVEQTRWFDEVQLVVA